MHLDDWARHWGVSPAAMRDLKNQMGISENYNSKGGMLEKPIEQRARLAASKKGVRLWVNTRGALKNEVGRPIRFGLMNDTKELNKVIKSHDLIGVTPRIVTAEDVGKTFGIFTSYEVKEHSWVYTGKGREVQQLRWMNLILSLGGISKFITDPKDI